MMDADTRERFACEDGVYDDWTRNAERERIEQLERLEAEFLKAARVYAEGVRDLRFLSLWEISTRRDTMQPEEAIIGFIESVGDCASDILDADRVRQARAIAEGEEE